MFSTLSWVFTGDRPTQLGEGEKTVHRAKQPPPQPAGTGTVGLKSNMMNLRDNLFLFFSFEFLFQYVAPFNY